MNHLEVFVLGFGRHLLEDLRRGRVFLHETRNRVSIHGHVPGETVAFVITQGLLMIITEQHVPGSAMYSDL